MANAVIWARGRRSSVHEEQSENPLWKMIRNFHAKDARPLRIHSPKEAGICSQKTCGSVCTIRAMANVTCTPQKRELHEGPLGQRVWDHLKEAEIK